MIKKETTTRKDGVKLFRTYSDDNKKIRKVGTDEVYDVAVDLTEIQYEETDEEIVKDTYYTEDGITYLGT